MNLARGRFCVSGPGWRERGARLSCSGSGDGFSSLLAFRLEGLALHFAHFLFEGALKVRRGLAELGHELAQAACEFRQLLWPENDQDHDKHYDHVRDAQHCVCEPSKGSMGIIERVPAAVKPDFTVGFNLSLSGHVRER